MKPEIYVFILSSYLYRCFAIVGPITEDFVQYLKEVEHTNSGLLRHVKSFDHTGSFGGKSFPQEKVKHSPIVFIHGNSDSALKYGNDQYQSGWDTVVQYFMDRGYTLAELYGISYGDRNMTQSVFRVFNCQDLLLHRQLLLSVLVYTGARHIDIIAHSMGVSIARAIIQGGKFTSEKESCDLGSDFSSLIGTFIAISSANYGMCSCEAGTAFPACDKEIGFFPGYCPRQNCSSPSIKIGAQCYKTKYSKFLTKLNKVHKKEAEFIASIWSKDDEVFLKGNLVWGKQTSLVPGSNIWKEYPQLTHMETKTETAADQFKIITSRSAPSAQTKKSYAKRKNWNFY
ncbi:LIPaSe related [Caenorhabditis elegans]|uniref:LIPaSe related n=1 Tax=Caenorhabditis elegans TaxID=6239 RepID=Q17622_CAEEL|nr:LIPaSe related [Caenorhabditis elegans]CAA93529.2 LIPaSe related [Caenorhabditis elegans]|eukprot:NP_001309445.1 LIPaSe related [Caenorhabditis elegans]